MNKPRGKPFQAGNAFGRGRPEGSRNKSTSARRLLEQHYQSLMAKHIQAAYGDNDKVRQWCLEQSHRHPAPTRKLKLPPLRTLEDCGRAQEIILQAVAQGQRTAADGVALMGMVEEKRKLIETQTLIPRIEELERMVKSLQGE